MTKSVNLKYELPADLGEIKGKNIPVTPDANGVFFRETRDNGRRSFVASVQDKSIIVSVQRQKKNNTTEVIKTFVDPGAKDVIVQLPGLGHRSRLVINND